MLKQHQEDSVGKASLKLPPLGLPLFLSPPGLASSACSLMSSSGSPVTSLQVLGHQLGRHAEGGDETLLASHIPLTARPMNTLHAGAEAAHWPWPRETQAFHVMTKKHLLPTHSHTDFKANFFSLLHTNMYTLQDRNIFLFKIFFT